LFVVDEGVLIAAFGNDELPARGIIPSSEFFISAVQAGPGKLDPGFVQLHGALVEGFKIRPGLTRYQLPLIHDCRDGLPSNISCAPSSRVRSGRSDGFWIPNPGFEQDSSCRLGKQLEWPEPILR
jgi:hypothetical protein